MEPQQNPNQPQPNVERAALPNVESLQPVKPEQAPQPAAPEKQAAAPVDPAAGIVPPQLPVTPPVNPAPAGAAAPATPSPSATPLQAADVDVIEKEWVDQANRIIEQTKDDPHAEEEAVEALQIDYLKKRYGHNVKKPEDQ